MVGATQTQSQPKAVWSIDNLEVIENPPAEEPSNIVPATTPFILQVTFSGKGLAWQTYEADKAQYQAEFFIESHTQDRWEKRVGVVTGNLNPSHPAEYKVSCQVDPAALPAPMPTVLIPGVYDLTCTITFPGKPGTVGYISDVLMQVY